jgi:hypothetical protein
MIRFNSVSPFFSQTKVDSNVESLLFVWWGKPFDHTIDRTFMHKFARYPMITNIQLPKILAPIRNKSIDRIYLLWFSRIQSTNGKIIILSVSSKIYFLLLFFLNMMESIFFVEKLCPTVLALEDRSVVHLLWMIHKFFVLAKYVLANFATVSLAKK